MYTQAVSYEDEDCLPDQYALLYGETLARSLTPHAAGSRESSGVSSVPPNTEQHVVTTRQSSLHRTHEDYYAPATEQHINTLTYISYYYVMHTIKHMRVAVGRWYQTPHTGKSS